MVKNKSKENKRKENKAENSARWDSG